MSPVAKSQRNIRSNLTNSVLVTLPTVVCVQREPSVRRRVETWNRV